MAKGTLVGVRFQEEDLARIDRLCEVFGAQVKSVKFTRPMAVRAACMTAADLLLETDLLLRAKGAKGAKGAKAKGAKGAKRKRSTPLDEKGEA